MLEEITRPKVNVVEGADGLAGSPSMSHGMHRRSFLQACGLAALRLPRPPCPRAAGAARPDRELHALADLRPAARLLGRCVHHARRVPAAAADCATNSRSCRGLRAVRRDRIGSPLRSKDQQAFHRSAGGAPAGLGRRDPQRQPGDRTRDRARAPEASARATGRAAEHRRGRGHGRSPLPPPPRPQGRHDLQGAARARVGDAAHRERPPRPRGAEDPRLQGGTRPVPIRRTLLAGRGRHPQGEPILGAEVARHPGVLDQALSLVGGGAGPPARRAGRPRAAGRRADRRQAWGQLHLPRIAGRAALHARQVRDLRRHGHGWWRDPEDGRQVCGARRARSDGRRRESLRQGRS